MLAILFASVLIAPATAQPVPEILRTDGARLVYNGQTVVLKGTNFDNINALGATVGPRGDRIGTGRVGDVLFRQEDYARVAAEGANHVRFGLDYGWYANDRAAFFAMLDTQIGYARAADLWILPQLFSTPANCYEGYSEVCGIWTNLNEQAALAAFWRDLAGRYRNEPVIAGFGLLNEPTPPGPRYCALWFDVARRVITSVRQVDANRVLFVATCSDPTNNLQYNNPPRGPGIAWEVHDYFPMDMSHDMFSPGSVYPGVASEWFGSCYVDKREMAGETRNCQGYGNLREHYGITYAAQQGVPIYIGEWGSTSRLNGYVAYQRDKAELYRDWGLSHAHYTWRHQTIRTGGEYQWGISSTTGGVDDPEKLEAVKVSWQGAVRPGFGAPPPSATPAPTQTATPGASPTPVGTRVPTATPHATVAPSATPAAAGSVHAWVADGALVVESSGGMLTIITAPEWGEAVDVPEGCADQLGGIVCWDPPGTMRLPLPAGRGTAAAAVGEALVTVSWGQ
jgi:hypothetical protein